MLRVGVSTSMRVSVEEHADLGLVVVTQCLCDWWITWRLHTVYTQVHCIYTRVCFNGILKEGAKCKEDQKSRCCYFASDFVR